VKKILPLQIKLSCDTVVSNCEILHMYSCP